jgi:hypothetical protein
MESRLDYVVITGTIRDNLKIDHLTSYKQEELYGFRYHSFYTTIQKNDKAVDTAWLYKVTDEKKLLLAAVKYGIQFYKTYHTDIPNSYSFW